MKYHRLIKIMETGRHWWEIGSKSTTSKSAIITIVNVCKLIASIWNNSHQEFNHMKLKAIHSVFRLLVESLRTPNPKTKTVSFFPPNSPSSQLKPLPIHISNLKKASQLCELLPYTRSPHHFMSTISIV